ncbi:hypothetical protein D3C86_1239150 [compost metagenome]
MIWFVVSSLRFLISLSSPFNCGSEICTVCICPVLSPVGTELFACAFAATAPLADPTAAAAASEDPVTAAEGGFGGGIFGNGALTAGLGSSFFFPQKKFPIALPISLPAILPINPPAAAPIAVPTPGRIMVPIAPPAAAPAQPPAAEPTARLRSSPGLAFTMSMTSIAVLSGPRTFLPIFIAPLKRLFPVSKSPPKNPLAGEAAFATSATLLSGGVRAGLGTATGFGGTTCFAGIAAAGEVLSVAGFGKTEAPA